MQNSPTYYAIAACLMVLALGLVANYFQKRRGLKGRAAFVGLAVVVGVLGFGLAASAGLVSWQALAIAAAAAPIFGAVTVTPVTAPSGQNPLKDTYVAQIAATADADVTATVTHNFALSTAAQPFTEVQITNMLAPVAASSPNWAVTARGANTVTMTKNATAGSGQVGNQVEVRVKRPHTIGL